MPRSADASLRDRILTAASALFYERGVNGVGMADVTAAADCGKNALYRHFPSKTDLAAAYLDVFGGARDRQMDRATEGIDDAAEALVALTRDVAVRAEREDFNGCAVRNYMREARSLDDVAGERAIEALDRWRARIDDLVGQLGVDDPQTLADEIWLVHEGIYGSTRPREAGRVGVTVVERLVS